MQTVPGQTWFAMLRLYGPLQPSFDMTWRPGEIEPQPKSAIAKNQSEPKRCPVMAPFPLTGATALSSAYWCRPTVRRAAVTIRVGDGGEPV